MSDLENTVKADSLDNSHGKLPPIDSNFKTNEVAAKTHEKEGLLHGQGSFRVTNDENEVNAVPDNKANDKASKVQVGDRAPRW